MKFTASKARRVALVAALSGTLALSPVAMQPASADLAQFSSNATGFALRVTVDLSGLPQTVKDTVQQNYTTTRAALPAAQQAELPEAFPFVVDQYLGRTTAEASTNTTKAYSVLGDGFRTLPALTATTIGDDKSSTLQTISLPSVQLPVLDATAGVLRAAVAAGPKVDGGASVASVDTSLQAVGALLPAELQAAFTDLITQINSAVTTANTTLDDTTDEVTAALAGTPLASDPTVGPIIDSSTDLATAIQLPAIPNPLSTNLASIKDVASSTTAQKTADGRASSDSVSIIKSVDVLGGLVNVGLMNLASHSEAAGTAGSAKNTSACSIADVRMGGNTGASLDGKSLYVEVGGKPVALPVPTDQVAAVKSQVDSVLNQAGVSVNLCDASKASASEDGTSASQSVSAFVIEFAPKAPVAIDALGIAAGDTLVKVRIDPTVETAVGAQALNAPAVGGAQLPATGAPAMVSMISGLLLAAGALTLRRRVR
ncbi:MAG TPA: LPXTG cell wall anchor domain-containing protein [Actinomycetota bacterium]|nr:LPXTG cell wall anchor domain-containing protein [Actinomycetota bacterium]